MRDRTGEVWLVGSINPEDDFGSVVLVLSSNMAHKTHRIVVLSPDRDKYYQPGERSTWSEAKYSWGDPRGNLRTKLTI